MNLTCESIQVQDVRWNGLQTKNYEKDSMESLQIDWQSYIFKMTNAY